MQSSEKWVEKNSMPLFYPVQKGFLEPFELAFHFSFLLILENRMPGKNLLVSDVGRWGVLDEWSKRKRKRKGDLGNKKRKLHLETLEVTLLFWLNFYTVLFWDTIYIGCIFPTPPFQNVSKTNIPTSDIFLIL